LKVYFQEHCEIFSKFILIIFVKTESRETLIYIKNFYRTGEA
jgi:hypothetical protein